MNNEPTASGEPVAWMHKNPDYAISKHRSLEYNIPLYTHPAKTLTDEEIKEVWTGTKWSGFEPIELTFARAILRKAQEK